MFGGDQLKKGLEAMNICPSSTKKPTWSLISVQSSIRNAAMTQLVAGSICSIQARYLLLKLLGKKEELRLVD